MRIEIEIKDEEIVRIVNSVLDPSPIGKRFYMHGEKSLPCHVSTPGQERTDEVALTVAAPMPDAPTTPDAPSATNESPSLKMQDDMRNYFFPPVGVAIFVIIVAIAAFVLGYFSV